MSRIIRGSQQTRNDIRPFTPQASNTEQSLRYRSSVGMDRIIRGASPAPIQAFALPYLVSADQEYLPAGQAPATGSLPMPSAETMAPLPADPSLAAEAAPQGLGTSLPDSGLVDRELVLRRAQEEAERYLAEARARTADLEAEAYRQGFSKGEEEARREAAAQLQPVLASFQQATSYLAGLRLNVLRQAEEDVVTLAFQLARKIIHQEALEHREVLTQTLRRAFDRLADQEHVEIRVHPADLEYARSLQTDLMQRTSVLKTLTMKADASVGQGGCIVESALGTVDARLEVQADELEQRFRQQRLTAMEVSAA